MSCNPSAESQYEKDVLPMNRDWPNMVKLQELLLF